MILKDFVDYEDYGFESYEAMLYSEILKAITHTGAKIIIVDNITFLKDKLEKSDKAIPLMKFLAGLKQKYQLSIMILAHTPKRDESKKISMNDLGGSKHISNFCDSAFAIGRSQQGSEIRYLKQIKQRSCPQIYGFDNVAVFDLSQPGNLLKFDFIGFSDETDHLKILTKKEREQIEDDILEMYQNNPEMSYGKIAEALGTYKMRVSRVINKNKT